jgi:hypothetical protein
MRANTNSGYQSKSPSIACDQHSGQLVTHICCLSTCLIPLCSKCIKDHNQFHKADNTYPEIEAVDDVKEFCGNKIRSSIVNFSSELEKLQKYTKGGQVSETDDGIKKIKKSKQLVLEIVNSFYQDLEDRYIKRVSSQDTDVNPREIMQLSEKIKKITEKLDKLYISLENKDFLSTMKSIMLRDLDDEYSKLKSEINREIGFLKTNPFLIQIDEAKLKVIYQELEQYITVQNTHEAMLTPKSKRLLNNAAQNQERTDFQVNINDYFDPNVYKKYIHFFQHKSKNLHLLDLDLSEQQSICEFEKVELNIDFKIPRWHRSIVTPFSEIYLTGGVDVENSDFKLNNSYVYDFNNRTLIEISSMNIGRSGHAIIYLNGYIYALGGFSEEKEFTDKCERYNIRKNTWENIAPMKVKSNNPCACTFRGKYLYKFGGKVDDNQLCNVMERYNPLVDKWSIVEFDIPKEYNYSTDAFFILSSSACVQINHNQIFVFGGTYADYSQKSGQTFILSIEEKDDVNSSDKRMENSAAYSVSHKIKGLNEYPLPIPEGFWNNQVVINNKKLYALQNVQNEKNNSVVYLDRRRVLEYDYNEGWKMLN